LPAEPQRKNQYLDHVIERGGDPSKIASVASFFVSRIDVAVDKLIAERTRQAGHAGGQEALSLLRGKIAIAIAKLAYQGYKRLFAGRRWEKLRAKGARVQRLLWASTGTKNPDYSHVLYVEELIAPDTVNTLPPATMDAFRDHGRVRASLEENIDHAVQMMATLDRSGISIDAVTAKLVDEGVRLFADAFDKLLGVVSRKRAARLGEELNGQNYRLAPELEKAIATSLETWRRDAKVRRLWAGDASLWTSSDEGRWLGWLSVVEQERQRIDALSRLAEDIRLQGFTHILLLGMGGSSLGPEVPVETFGRQTGRPKLLVLDSTDPAQIRTVESQIDPARTLFIVSSKSGSTLEPNILKQYFFECAKRAVGAQAARSHFIAITDPGSQMQKIAERDQFRHTAFGMPSIGGRYSVLSAFGLVPAAAMGLDVSRLLIPVDAEPLGVPQVYRQDRLFGYLRLTPEPDARQDAAMAGIERAGQPVVHIAVTDRYHIGQEFFRWELATAVAGSILGINPFDQPDVEASKVKTHELTTTYELSGRLPPETALFEEGGLAVFADEKNRLSIQKATTLVECLAAHFGRIREGDYFALLAYVERSARDRDALQEIRVLIRDRLRIATCLGFGPRFLHSTGQAYKGGPNAGVFLQITCDDPADVRVPDQKYTFGIVKAAEARGDLDVLAERGRRVLRIHLGPHVAAGLTALKDAVRQALA
jgi:glucose-6-phosphate isomerase